MVEAEQKTGVNEVIGMKVVDEKTVDPSTRTQPEALSKVTVEDLVTKVVGKLLASSSPMAKISKMIFEVTEVVSWMF